MASLWCGHGSDRVTSDGQRLHLAVEAFEGVGDNSSGDVIADPDAAAAELGLRLAWSSKLARNSGRTPGGGSWRAPPPSLSLRELLWMPAGDVPACCDLEQVGLRVGGRGHVITHVQHDDLRGPGGPLPGQPAATPNTHARSPPASSNGTLWLSNASVSPMS